MSHLLRATGGGDENDDITPPESPKLLNALRLAARSGSGGSDENSQEGFSPLPMSPSNYKLKSNNTSSSTLNSHSSNEHSIASSYANSIEAMAATVEAAAIKNRQRSKRSPKKSPKRKNKGSGGSVSAQYQGTITRKKQLLSSSSSTNNNMMKKKRIPVPKLTAVHLVVIIILVPFVMMEAFLSMLVFAYNNGISSMSVVGGRLTVASTADVVSSTADVVSSTEDDHSDVREVHLNVNDDVDHQEVHQEQQSVNFDDQGEESDEENDVIVVPPPTTEDAEVGNDGVTDHPQTETEIENTDDDDDDDENDVDTAKSNIVAMQSMLKEALTKLNNNGSDRHGKKAVETLCLTVWSRGVEALSSLTNENENDEDNNDTWNALAMDAQRCIAGAELVYLSRDVNIDSVRKAKVIFESLSDVDPDNASVRAGLGTSLLILGVMKEDASFLKLAMFHLKTASSLCQKAQLVEKDEQQPQSIFQSDPSAMSAAILHNLALASIALGDDVSPVSLLLRSEAIRREVSSNHPANLFWNCHRDALLTIEQQAVLMGAKSTTMRQKKKTKFKIPFLSDRFGTKVNA